MSDTIHSYPEPTKVIGIKPPQEIKSGTADELDENGYETDHDRDRQVQDLSKQIENLRKEKATLIAQTRSAIEEEKTAWQTEKAQWIDAAKKEGYQAGFASGKEDSLQEYHRLVEKANMLADAGLADYHATVEKSTEAILSLAIKSAEKILHQHLDKHPEDFIGLVKEVITELKRQTAISVYLAPDDYDYVLKQKEELLNVIGADMQLSLYIQNDFAPGHCLVVHPHGQIDASIDTQLSEIRQALETTAREQIE